MSAAHTLGSAPSSLTHPIVPVGRTPSGPVAPAGAGYAGWVDSITAVSIGLSVALFFTFYAGAVVLYAYSRPRDWKAHLGRRGLMSVGALGTAVGAACFGVLLYQWLFPLGT